MSNFNRKPNLYFWKKIWSLVEHVDTTETPNLNGLPKLVNHYSTSSESYREKIYNPMLPIFELKKDLEKLCKNKIIPIGFHNEYSKLKFESTVRDKLPETDIEHDDNLNIESD